MSKVADPLRGCARAMGDGDHDKVLVEQLMACADEIDAEHKRRMDQARRDQRKAAMRYIARIVEEYKHGRKRVRQYRGDHGR